MADVFAGRPHRRDVLLGLSRWTGSLVLARTMGVLAPGPAFADTPSTAAEAVSLKVNLVTGNLINFSYVTPNGNRPKTFGNVAYLWAVSADQVPWNRPAQVSLPILLDEPAGDQNFENVTVASGSYLIGYAVGPKLPDTAWSPYANVVASAYIPAQGQSGSAASTGLTLRYIGTTSLAFDFAFPAGFDAKGSGAWVGLWRGRAASYVSPPAWSSPIDVASDSGNWGMDALTLDRGAFYTLGLLSSGYSPTGGTAADPNRLACTVTFAVPA